MKEPELDAKLGRLERFFDLHAPIYDATRAIVLHGRDEAVRRLDIRPGDSVLELACGTGLNFPRLRRAGAAHITGVDLSAKMLERARRRDPDARLLRADFLRADLGGPFPRALCTFALSLLPEPVDAVLAMRRHLTPDGVLVILDFGPLEGAARPLDPLWRAWLAHFGARTDLPRLAERWTPHFDSVTMETTFGGMAAIVRMEGPRQN